jgi:hypothetical protein
MDPIREDYINIYIVRVKNLKGTFNVKRVFTSKRKGF